MQLKWFWCIGTVLNLLFWTGLTLEAWESQLFPYNAGAGAYEEATVNFAGEDWRLFDYSYVGYQLGELPLQSNIPSNVVTISGSGDITTELQTKLDSVGVAGGGIVKIPAGHYALSASVGIHYPNVSLVGAGSHLTTIDIPATISLDENANTYEGIVNFELGNNGWHKGWIETGTELSQVTAIVPVGSQSITGLTAPDNISVGSWIVVQQYFWSQFILDNSLGYWPLGNRGYSFTYLRKVVSKSGNSIVVDAPIPWTLDPAHNTIYIKQSGPALNMLDNAGVAGITFTFADNNNGTNNRPVGAAVYTEGAMNIWIYDVEVYNFPRFGFYIDNSARVTLLDCAVKKAQDYGEDGYGYAYHITYSQNVLIKRCYAEDARHNFIFSHALTSNVVETQCESIDCRLGDDTHHSLCHAILRDQCFLTHGNRLCQYNRTTWSDNAYETFGSGVLWNIVGDGFGGIVNGAKIELKPSPDGSAMVIGGPGVNRVYDNTVGNPYAQGDWISTSSMQVGPHGLQNVLYEGVGQATPVSPASLYQAQLENRLGILPGEWNSVGGSDPVLPAPTATPDTGPGILVYNSDQAAWGTSFGSACPQPLTTLTPGCNLDDAGQVHGGLESIRMDPVGSAWNPLITFGGPGLNCGDLKNVEMWIYPTTPDLAFYVNLYDGINEVTVGSAVLLDASYVGGAAWQLNTWNKVVIPIQDFSYTGVFQGIRFSNTGSTPGSQFYLDDIQISQVDMLTPSQTPTVNPSASITRTPTRTPTTNPSAQITRTLTKTPAYTRTPVPTQTYTHTMTPTIAWRSDLMWYPNPAREHVIFAWRESTVDSIDIDIYNSNGERVLRLLNQAVKEQQFTCDIHLLAPGFYFCRVQLRAGSRILDEKMVKFAVLK